MHHQGQVPKAPTIGRIYGCNVVLFREVSALAQKGASIYVTFLDATSGISVDSDTSFSESFRQGSVDRKPGRPRKSQPQDREGEGVKPRQGPLRALRRALTFGEKAETDALRETARGGHLCLRTDLLPVSPTAHAADASTQDVSVDGRPRR